MSHASKKVYVFILMGKSNKLMGMVVSWLPLDAWLPGYLATASRAYALSIGSKHGFQALVLSGCSKQVHGYLALGPRAWWLYGYLALEL